MIANSLKNFFKCLVYIFVPLGCVFLGFLLGLQVFLDALASQAAYLTDEIAQLVGGTQAQFDRLVGFVVASLRGLDWSDPLGTLNMLLEGEWISARIAEFLELTVEEASQLEDKIVELSVSVASALLVDFIFLVLCTVLGMVLGYFVTNSFVRKSTVRRGFSGFIIASVVDAVLSATLIAFVAWFLTFSHAGAVVTAVVGALVFGFVSLLEAYLLHARGKLPFRAVVNLKNCLFVYLSQLVVLCAAGVLCALALLLIGSFVAYALVVAVVIIALLVNNVNAESYVDRMAKTSPFSERRLRTFARLGDVPDALREKALLDETLSDRAEE